MRDILRRLLHWMGAASIVVPTTAPGCNAAVVAYDLPATAGYDAPAVVPHEQVAAAVACEG